MNIARMYNREMFLRLLVVTLSLVSTHSTATDESELWTQKSAPLVPSYPNHRYNRASRSIPRGQSIRLSPRHH